MLKAGFLVVLKQCENLSYNDHITEIPDVTGVKKLEKLSFKHCENLTKIHDSVGFLENLKILDASSCKLISLTQLNLSHCPKLEGFPEILGKMENITELHITGSPIKELPFSIQNFSRLQKLELQYCGMVWIPSSIVMLLELGSMCISKCEVLQLSKLDKGEKKVSKSSNMEGLALSHSNVSDDFLPTGLTLFVNVKDLNLSGNNFTVLHACFKECHLLRNLNLDDCRFLREIRGIPRKLETLSVKGCTSLKCLDLTVLPACTEGCHFLKELILDDCVYLQEIGGRLLNLDHFSAKDCTSLTSSCTNMLLNQETRCFFLPGRKIPEWFTRSTRGGSMSFRFRNKFPAMSLCLVIGLVDEQRITVKFSPVVFINGKKHSLGIQKIYELKMETDHMFLFDVQLLKFEDNVDVGFPDNKWNHVEVSYSDPNSNDKDQRLVGKYSGIHVFKEANDMEDILFNNSAIRMQNVTSEPFLEWPSKRITTQRPQTDQTMVLSTPILTSIQPLPTEVEKGLTSQSTLSVERPWEDAQGETSERLPDDEVHPTSVQNDPPVIERRIQGVDVELEAVSSCELESEESSSNTTVSDSDDPFDLVDAKLSVSSKGTISLGDASLVSVREAIETLELLMIKDLSEISSDSSMQSQLDHFLNLLTRSSHHKVTVEVKEALVEFRRKAFASFLEFQTTIEPVNKLKNFKKQKAKIQEETSAGKNRRKDLKNSIKKASLAIKAENSRKKDLESEIANIRKLIDAKEMELKQLVLNVKNKEAELSTYVKNRDSLDEQARALFKEADDLLTANKEIEDEVKAAEVKQNVLMSTWLTDLPSQLNKIKNNIFGL